MWPAACLRVVFGTSVMSCASCLRHECLSMRHRASLGRYDCGLGIERERDMSEWFWERMMSSSGWIDRINQWRSLIVSKFQKMQVNVSSLFLELRECPFSISISISGFHFPSIPSPPFPSSFCIYSRTSWFFELMLPRKWPCWPCKKKTKGTKQG